MLAEHWTPSLTRSCCVVVWRTAFAFTISGVGVPAALRVGFPPRRGRGGEGVPEANQANTSVGKDQIHGVQWHRTQVSEAQCYDGEVSTLTQTHTHRHRHSLPDSLSWCSSAKERWQRFTPPGYWFQLELCFKLDRSKIWQQLLWVYFHWDVFTCLTKIILSLLF